MGSGEWERESKWTAAVRQLSTSPGDVGKLLWLFADLYSKVKNRNNPSGVTNQKREKKCTLSGSSLLPALLAFAVIGPDASATGPCRTWLPTPVGPQQAPNLSKPRLQEVPTWGSAVLTEGAWGHACILQARSSDDNFITGRRQTHSHAPKSLMGPPSEGAPASRVVITQYPV